MSDYFGNVNRLQKIGLLLSALNPQSMQNTMGLAQAGQWMRDQQRDDDRDAAANRSLQIEQNGLTPTFAQEAFVGNAMDKSVTQDLMVRASGGPAAYFKNRMAMDAEANKPIALPKDAILTNRSGEVLASNVLPEDGPADPTSVAEYDAAKAGGYKGSYLDYRKEIARAGSSNINLSTGQRMGAELEKNFAPLLEKSYDDALAARDTVINTRQIRDVVKQGIITGTGANFRLGFTKALATAGIIEGENVANTEVFVTQMGRNVLNLVKGLGAGSGISNADLKFAERVAAGDITLDERTINRVLDIQERAASAKVKSYGERFGGFFESEDYPESLKAPYRIKVPDAASEAGTPQGGVSTPKTDAEYKALPSGATYIDPDDGKTYRKP